jgi:hypothetical protein
LQAAPGDGQGTGTSREPRTPDRRSDRRYPINAEVRYCITNRQRVIQTGYGRIIDISSAGVLFESGLALPRGLKIELSIAWPALSSTSSKLELHAEGRTVRAEHNRTAAQIHRYTFRAAQTTSQGDNPESGFAARRPR